MQNDGTIEAQAKQSTVLKFNESNLENGDFEMF